MGYRDGSLDKSTCAEPDTFSIDPFPEPTLKLDVVEQAHSFDEMEEDTEDYPEAWRPVILAHATMKISCVAFTHMNKQTTYSHKIYIHIKLKPSQSSINNISTC